MKVLLLCGSGPLGLKVLYCLHTMGIYVETAGSTGANMLKYSRYSRHHSFIHFWSDNAPIPTAEEWLCQYAEKNKFDIIIPADIPSAAFIASVKKRFPHIPCFPCSDIEVLDILHNKWTFSEVCHQHNIPIPTTILLESVDQLKESLFDEVGFPLIVKPLEAESSHGVVKLDNYEQLVAHVQNDSKYSKPPLIAQSFIPGQDIDISFLSSNDKVLCSTVQSWVAEGILEFTSNAEMSDIVAQIVQAFHYEGLAHLDMRIDSRTNKLYVIECNPRAWYTISASMWQGLNFVEAGISFTLNGAIPPISERAGNGRYCLGGSLLKQCLSFSGWKNLSVASVKGFLQAATDPLPHLSQKVRLTKD